MPRGRTTAYDLEMRSEDTNGEPQAMGISLGKDIVSMTTRDAHLLLFA